MCLYNNYKMKRDVKFDRALQNQLMQIDFNININDYINLDVVEIDEVVDVEKQQLN